MTAVDPGDVTSLTAGEAATVVPLVTAMARAYTRGQGFTDGEPCEEVAAVVTTAAARLAANGSQLRRQDTAGDFTRTLSDSFHGWTLAELFVLNRYRVRAM
jgi:hypothetical protein